MHATFDTNTASTVSELELGKKRTDDTEGPNRLLKKAEALLKARARAGAGAGAGSGAEDGPGQEEEDIPGAAAATVRIFLEVLHSGTEEADQWLQELEEDDLLEELAAVLEEDGDFDECNINHDAAVEETQKELCEEDLAKIEGEKVASLLNKAGWVGGLSCSTVQ